MTVHLIKLCVGVKEVAELAAWQAARRDELRAQGKTPENIHVTRMTPRRRAEILDGGSLYWVIRGFVQARQRIVDLRSLTGRDGVVRCGIVLDPEIVLCTPQPRRPFQGWRYLKAEEAPADLPADGGGDWQDMPDQMRAELMALGLL